MIEWLYEVCDSVIGMFLAVFAAVGGAIAGAWHFLDRSIGTETGRIVDELELRALVTGTVLPATAKIVFVLIILFTFAPVLIWAERRQSAMMQDRIGPVRAGIRLPLSLAKVIRGAGLGAFGVAGLCLVPILAAVIGGMNGLPRPELISIGVTVGLFHIVAGQTLRILIPADGNVTVFGLLHPAADALKLVWKEDFVPPNADKFLHAAAPIIALIPALATFAVIPFGPTYYPDFWSQINIDADVTIGHAAIPLQIASLDVGILYIFAIAGTGVVGAAIAGYSSDNKYSLLGGLRAAGQMVSYEVALGLSLVGCFLVYNSIRIEEMVEWQRAHVWGVFVQPVAFILFFASAIAETKRIPFDVPEGESEIVGGYFTEYSGMKFGMFFMGEFIEVVTSSALLVTLFLGGYEFPFADALSFGWLPEWFPAADWIREHLAVPGMMNSLLLGVLSDGQPLTAGAHLVEVIFGVLIFIVKLSAVIWLQLTIRWSLPRFRYDQIMKLCWTVLLPLALLNIVITAAVVMYLRSGVGG